MGYNWGVDKWIKWVAVFGWVIGISASVFLVFWVWALYTRWSYFDKVRPKLSFGVECIEQYNPMDKKESKSHPTDVGDVELSDNQNVGPGTLYVDAVSPYTWSRMNPYYFSNKFRQVSFGSMKEDETKLLTRVNTKNVSDANLPSLLRMVFEEYKLLDSFPTFPSKVCFYAKEDWQDKKIFRYKLDFYSGGSNYCSQDISDADFILSRDGTVELKKGQTIGASYECD